MNKNFKDLKITIGEGSSYFTIVLEHNGLIKKYNFHQDDTREELIEVFKELGFENVVYEEWY